MIKVRKGNQIPYIIMNQTETDIKVKEIYNRRTVNKKALYVNVKFLFKFQKFIIILERKIRKIHLDKLGPPPKEFNLN